MRLLNLKLFFFFSAVFVFSVIPALSATISVLRSISFGTIIASPNGEIIEINARNGPATPVVFTSGNSIMTGGFSGIIRVTSDMPSQTIIMTYPASTLLTAAGATNMTLDGMTARSKFVAISAAAGENIDFDVGGRLHIAAGQQGRFYTATMTITVDIINP